MKEMNNPVMVALSMWFYVGGLMSFYISNLFPVRGFLYFAIVFGLTGLFFTLKGIFPLKEVILE